ncbi:MAG: hypothetical protein EOO60_05750 [Hymenobacter sp.]|nr:MAG: hypothetical protein EOO60_05750 [Hymenobacter sp.]
MASFYAELHVAGATYPVRHCVYEFTQATSERGRVVAKVRHGLVQLTLDVPDDDKLLDWAHTPYKPLVGQISFYDAKGGPVLETLAWEEGQCVGYQEEFTSGDQRQGAYVCHLTIATPKLTMHPGGPAAYMAPAAGEHGPPASAAATVVAAAKLKAEEAATGLVKKVITPAGEVGTEILGVGLATIARTASLTLGLLLTPTNSRDDPGYASEWELYRRNHAQFKPLTPDQLRLAQLERLHEQGDLTSEEEAELIALLAEVKGIHVQKLTNLKTVSADFVGKVPMEESDLGRMALKYRIENGIWHDGNIAVFEYENNQGNLQHLVQGTLPTTRKHAERLALEKLKADGIPSENVKRIYSELEPCEVGSGGLQGEGCKAMINNNFPAAKVTYSYEYKGAYADTKLGRQASIEQRAADLAKHKKLLP